MENTPNVRSGGQLVSQGYHFMWFGSRLYGKPSEEALVRTGLTDPFCFGTSPGEQCFLITPLGKRIHLFNHNRVPYFSEDVVDLVSTCSNTVNNIHRDDDLISKPDIEYSVEDSSVGPDAVVGPVDSSRCAITPVLRKRITGKSTVELTDSQQAVLDHAMTRQLVDSTLVEYDVLHFMSHRDCALCREVKQRRNYSRPIAEENKHLAKKIYEKTG